MTARAENRRAGDGRLAAWRRERLLRGGFPATLAARLAGGGGWDLHALIELGRAGMPGGARGAYPRSGGGAAMTTAPPQAGVGARAALAAEPRAGSAASDIESRRWLADLRASGARREEALARLHALLLRAARFEVARRRASLADCGAVELDEIALESADDALVALLARLDRYRGLSRFTTWAYKFALLEAAVKVRRRAWRERELPLAPDGWESMAAADPSPQRRAESAELLRALKAGMDEALTAHQREVLSALALGAVPIDVLAERLGTTRGALYKTLHEARRRLCEHLDRTGWDGIPATSNRTGA